MPPVRKSLSLSDEFRTAAIDKWSSSFGAALVLQLEGILSVECGKGWHVGRYAIDIDAGRRESHHISVFATEDAHETWLLGTLDITEFQYRMENDPVLAAETVALWLQSR